MVQRYRIDSCSLAAGKTGARDVGHISPQILQRICKCEPGKRVRIDQDIELSKIVMWTTVDIRPLCFKRPCCAQQYRDKDFDHQSQPPSLVASGWEV